MYKIGKFNAICMACIKRNFIINSIETLFRVSLTIQLPQICHKQIWLFYWKYKQQNNYRTTFQTHITTLLNQVLLYTHFSRHE